MQPNQPNTSTMRAVTIAREYGSGGGEIAQRLAARLGWQLIDHEVVARVAQELHITEAEAASHDEQADSVLSRMLVNMQLLDSLSMGVPSPLLADEHTFAHAVRHVVLAAARKGQVVIIGRGAQILLGGRSDVLHIRTIAPLEDRIRYVMQREGLNHAAAQTRVQLKDRQRAHYIQVAHQQQTTDAHLYDLVINTGCLDVESAVDLIALALARKAQGVGASDTRLDRYPAAPEDLPTGDDAGG